MQLRSTIRILIAGCAVTILPMCAQAQNAAAPVVLDRVVAVVNRQAILQSDVDEEVRLSVLEPGGESHSTSRSSALQRLISRTLIQQQIRQEDAQASEPAPAEIQNRLMELRRALPACTRFNCSTDAGWSAFLGANQLTSAEVEEYMKRRLEVLTFIENRFRAGIRIPQEEIDQYYRDTLLPEYPKGSSPPSLDAVSSRIEEILLQQQVTKLFDAWLDNLRKQGDVEILDPNLQPKAMPAQGDDKQ